jgi:hypothetical protein
MGRTVPSFRLSQFYEESEWKPFRNALDRPDRKEFDRIFAASRLYVSACSYATRPVRIQAIFMAVAFHHHKQLAEIAEKAGIPLEEENEPVSR